MSIRRALIQITIIYSALVGVGALAVLAVLKKRTALSAWAVRILLILAFAPLLCLASAPEAIAAVATCRVANITQGTPGGSNLQAAINAARRGDTISVEGVCNGSFGVDIDLTLVGTPTPGHAKPVLHGESPSRVLRVDASVTLTNLTIVGGEAAYRGGRWDGAGGGIYVTERGSLVLNDAVVRGNRAWMEGGGISNLGELVLNGSSSVIGNTVRFDGHGGGIANHGTMILNDSSSVRGNRADEGGGITNDGVHDDERLVLGTGESRTDRRWDLARGPQAPPRRSSHAHLERRVLRARERRGGSGRRPVHRRWQHHHDERLVIGQRQPDGAEWRWDLERRGHGRLAAHILGEWRRGNRAGDTGGGIYLLTGPGLTMRGSSSVSGNSAKAGGGIATGGPPITMNGSSSVSGNTAVDAGGIMANGPLMLDGSSSVQGKPRRP